MYQTNSLPKSSLPTMYDLPSEEIGDSGLPDEYHAIQGQVLDRSFQPANYPSDRIFSAMDMNLYYDVEHTKWYKRPDWFGAVGVNRFYEERDMRKSYVIWQEEISPFIVVEMLSLSTQKEDLGQTLRSADEPPTKWQVYEQILQVPYYVVFDGASDRLRIFQLRGDRYQQLQLDEPRLWIPEIGLGIGLWLGNYIGVTRQWLRWYDRDNNWIRLPEEVAEQERQRAETENQRAEIERQRAEIERQRAEQERSRAEEERQKNERLMAQLRALGIEPDLD